MCDLEEEEEIGETKSPICDDEDFEMEDEMEISDGVNGKRRRTFFGEGNRSSQAFYINVARQKMAKMVIMHDLPISFSEFTGFKNAMQYLQPLLLANPITTAMVEEDILKLYEVEKPKIMRLLQSNGSKLAISVDVLTADEKNAYVAVTARFVDELWVLQSRIMRLIHVRCPYTAETLYDELIEFLMDWKVDRKLSAVTIDSCSTNDAMMSMWIERNSFVRKFTVDPKVMGRMFFPIRLVPDFEPKWSSTYVMLGTALEYKDVFIRLTEWDEEYVTLPTSSEWEKAKELCEHLEVFYRLIEMLSGTKHLTANAFVMICEIRLSINRWLKSSNDEIKSMATNMMATFDTYWEAVYGVLAVAIVLDPRFKMQYIEFFFSELYGDEAEDHVKRVYNLCSDLEKEYKKCGDSSVDHSNAVKRKGMGYIPECQIATGTEEFGYDGLGTNFDDNGGDEWL
ncbi:hypothetical protein Patl1_24632 [Pistacia atlantica]|uniref:Uncharacterized protein n=1 Tax=Pistacia atlantica TaxID=434234 RepID=A0ACC0ZVZ6_9ROSI|nr:hypothetical protein Patl1_24632 [Pistacia atlantica]